MKAWVKTAAVLCVAFLAGWPMVAPAQNIPTYTHTLPLVRPAGFQGQESLVRIINRSEFSGRVQVTAFDDAGDRFGPVTLTLGARQALNITSSEWERGNAAKGLPVGLGDGEGNWRFDLVTTLTIEPLAYIRTPDKFLTSMHDEAPVSEEGVHWVPFFNPGSNTTKVSHLRIINPGATAAEVTITGRDDAGNAASGPVRLTLAARGSRTLSAQDLEAGAGFGGRLGDGAGKWRLNVRSATTDIRVMSLLSTETGHLANLSTVPLPEPEPDVCPEDEEEFRQLWLEGRGMWVERLDGETTIYRLVRNDRLRWLRWNRGDRTAGIFTYRRTGPATAFFRKYIDGPPGEGGVGCEGVMTCESKNRGQLRQECSEESGEDVIHWRIGG